MVLNYKKNYYEILDVTVDSTSEEIKYAYRKMARKYHPDVNKSPDSMNIFKDVIEAYKILSNPTEREKYNTINGYFKSTQKISKEKSENYTSNAAKEEAEKKSSNTNTNNNKSSSTPKKTTKIHDSKVKSSSKNKERKTSTDNYRKNFFEKFSSFTRNLNFFDKNDNNITTEVVITPEEALSGCIRIVNIMTTKTCPKCFGKRFINSTKCQECDGKGEITTKRKIKVTIPKGIKSGTKLRIKGEGSTSNSKKARGDLYLVVKISAPEKIKIEKLNICYNVAITPYEAALGEEISINLFDEKIKLKLPPNTCSGQKFRIANHGIKKNGKIGDLIVTVSIEFSKDLSEDEIILYKKLKNLSKGKNETSKN